MIFRIATIAALCVTLTACAQSPMIGAPSLTTSALQFQSGNEMQMLGKPTLAGKVLTAIALERVTGLKPDPARFSEIH